MNTLEAHKLKAIGKILDAVNIRPVVRLDAIRRVLDWKTFPAGDVTETFSVSTQQPISETPRRHPDPETND